jgi:hypothetical protein
MVRGMTTSRKLVDAASLSGCRPHSSHQVSSHRLIMEDVPSCASSALMSEHQQIDEQQAERIGSFRASSANTPLPSDRRDPGMGG